MNSFFPPKFSPNSVEQWVRGFTTNLLAMSLNPAWDFKFFTFPPKNFKRIFGLNIAKFETSKLVKVF